MQTLQPCEKAVGRLLTKLNTFFPFCPAIPLLGVYPEEMKTYIHTETCTWMFLVVLFIMDKN